MKVTLNLDRDAMDAVERFSREQFISKNNAASELIRRGSRRRQVTHIVNGLHVISARPAAKNFTFARIKEIEEEMDLEYVRKFTGRKPRKAPR